MTATGTLMVPSFHLTFEERICLANAARNVKVFKQSYFLLSTLSIKVTLSNPYH